MVIPKKIVIRFAKAFCAVSEMELRFRVRHPQIDDDYLEKISCDSSDSGIIEALASLPEKFRLVLTLHYIEDYRVEDIAKIINRTSSAVKMRLQKGRKLLEKIYREEYL